MPLRPSSRLGATSAAGLESASAAAPGEWSGDALTYSNGVSEFSFDVTTNKWKPMDDAKNHEVRLADFSAEDEQRFSLSDVAGWEVIVGTQAVRILSQEESAEERIRYRPGGCRAADRPHGLDGAPVEWHRSVTGFIVSQLGHRRCLLEPCWFVRHDERGNLVGQLLLDVDDFLFGAAPSELSRLKATFMNKYEFGKWEPLEGEFLGRRILQLDDRVLADQEKNILESVKRVFLERGRRADHGSPASEVERRSFTSLVYQLNRVGKETRPEVVGTASLLAARVKAPTVGLEASAAAQLLRSTAAQEMIVWKFDPMKMQLIAISDCSGAGAADRVGAQGAWLVLAAEGDLQMGVSAKVTPLVWRSTRLWRIVSSTWAGKTQALTQAVFELEWLQLQLRDASSSEVVRYGWENGMLPYAIATPGNAELRGSSSQHVMVVDAKSVFDALEADGGLEAGSPHSHRPSPFAAGRRCRRRRPALDSAPFHAGRHRDQI